MFKASLLNQQREFRKLNQNAHTALAACGTHGHGQSKMAKMATSMGIHAKTMKDKLDPRFGRHGHPGCKPGRAGLRKGPQGPPARLHRAMQMLDELQQFEEHAAVEMREYL